MRRSTETPDSDKVRGKRPRSSQETNITAYFPARSGSVGLRSPSLLDPDIQAAAKLAEVQLTAVKEMQERRSDSSEVVVEDTRPFSSERVKSIDSLKVAMQDAQRWIRSMVEGTSGLTDEEVLAKCDRLQEEVNKLNAEMTAADQARRDMHLVENLQKAATMMLNKLSSAEIRDGVPLRDIATESKKWRTLKANAVEALKAAETPLAPGIIGSNEGPNEATMTERGTGDIHAMRPCDMQPFRRHLSPVWDMGCANEPNLHTSLTESRVCFDLQATKVMSLVMRMHIALRQITPACGSALTQAAHYNTVHLHQEDLSIQSTGISTTS